ncbi:zinc ABC transporter substrate-binding protein [Planococcus sp. N028]|uniref:Zinc ABC transporter substrate-binding protein n=1 Tax=Planococcus shixiaomingii TaxID=3058393 RepID=A0ABT8MXL2_9BACL|nr:MULTISPECIES: zinc ABC transporter substrate-binding protein [unclassified Planococcus (in: firmicutes)]MDN7240169.1 zinc ABC transporter substrate-binding protein [Planococcus sp. N028]WKA56074.1 zinc ABC transporter substrate-binding protein [Planococcus sp. N022]
MKKLIPLLILILVLSACGQSNGSQKNAEENGKVDVYTTVYPLTYFTERIGGDRVNVKSIYPAGSNEHTFEPTQQNMIALAEADLMFYVGLGLEGFISNAKKTLENEKVKFVATSDAISDEELEAAGTHEEEHEEHEEHAEHEEDGHEGHNHGSTDPHVWISPVLSQKLALSIKDSLVEKDPEGKELYEENYAQLIDELKQLDQAFVDLSDRVTNKTFFVSHSAFGYIAEPYGFEQIAVAGLNSQDEPSQKELTKIVDLAKEKNIKYIVFEQNVSSNLTEVIQKEVGAEAVQMHNLGVLTQDNIDNKETYFTLMEKNLQVLETVLK